jgi:multiple sugar transport system permease protein
MSLRGWPRDAVAGPAGLGNRPLPVGLAAYQTQYGTHYEWIMAIATLVTVPVFVLFLGLQRYFVQGIVMPGLKG